MTVHDCYTDHLGWGSGSGPAPLHEATPSSFLHEIIAKGHGQEVNASEYAVVIDSLSTLLDFHTPAHVCQLIHQLGRVGGYIAQGGGWGVGRYTIPLYSNPTAGRQCGLVVCLLHSDLHDSHVTSCLGHVMSTRIKVTPPPPPQTGVCTQ